MTYTVEFSSATGICLIRVAGQYRRPADSDELKRFAGDYAAVHGCRLFLIDLTQAEVIGGTMEAFDAANPQGEIAQKLRKLKTAFVRRPLTEEDRFYENVAVNRGFDLRAFAALEEASAWLRAPPAPD